jgi:hypothetical protein
MIASNETKGTNMIRKTILGLVAAASLATAFAPTTASAGYYGYGYGYRSHYSCYDCYKPSYSYSYGYKSYGYGY